MEEKKYTLLQKIGFFLGPVLGFILAFAVTIPGLPSIGCKALGLTLWMVIWWVTGPVPIWVTSLLPIAGSIVLNIAGKEAGVHQMLDGSEVAVEVYSNYASPVVIMCLGVFVIAAVIERWNLHKRIALGIVSKAGDRPFMIVMLFGVASAIISMFISNTTAAAMMLPIALALANQFNMSKDSPFAKALMLNTTFGCVLGGLGTTIGSGTNISAVGLINELTGIEVSFTEWLKMGLPLVIILCPLAAVVCWFVFRAKGTTLGDVSVIREELAKLGKMSKAETLSVIYLVVVILGIFFRSKLALLIPCLSDEGFGILIAVIAFLIPINFREGVFLMDGKYAMSKISWSTFLLLGGALQLGSIFKVSGVSTWVGSGLGFLADYPELVVVMVIAVLTAVLTEVCSNFVVVAAFMPVVYSLSVSLGMNPLILMMTITFASSFSFAMPTSTPPMALAFGSGYIEMKDMLKAGWLLKLVAIIVLPIVFYRISANISPLL